MRHSPRGVQAPAEARLPHHLLDPLPRADAGVRQGAGCRHLPHGGHRTGGLTLSLVGERNLVAGNSSGEEFFLASLVGEDLAGKI